MIRHVLAVALVVVGLVPSFAAAESVVLTVTAASADVHRFPSVGSPVIGHATRGRVLEVVRLVGDWVRVTWPDAPEGTGYVRKSLVTLAGTTNPATNGAAGTAPVLAARETATPSALDIRNEIATVDRTTRPAETAPLGSEYVRPPSHKIGIGGLVNGSRIGFGGSGRVWSRRRIGVQVEVSRHTLTPISTIGRVSSVQFAPSAIYSLKNHVRDSLWLRPYLGAGVRLSHLSFRPEPTVEALSENRRSWQVFGGSELTFPGAPRFAMSADLRYDSSNTPFAGFEFGGMGFAVSGHWYVR